MASAGENGKIIVWNWPARRAVGAVEPRDPNQPLYHVFAIPSADPLLLVNEAAGPSVISLATARRLSPGDPIPESLRSWLATNPKVRPTAPPRFPEPATGTGAGWQPVWAGGGGSLLAARSALTQSSARSIAITLDHRHRAPAPMAWRPTPDAGRGARLETLSGASRHVFGARQACHRAALNAVGKNRGKRNCAAADWRGMLRGLQWTFDLATQSARLP